MAKRILVANWKLHKTEREALAFFEGFGSLISGKSFDRVDILVCPSFPLLPMCFKYIKEQNLPILLGAQSVSAFPEGAHTGEVSAVQLKDFVTHVIIGHSERRREEHETDDDVEKKVGRTRENGLKSIVCIQDEHTKIPDDASFVAYEPIFAIGTGTPDTPDNIAQVFSRIHARTGRDALIYGGSVDPENIQSFLSVPYLSGFLVGTASLDPNSFFELLSQC